MKTLLMLLMFCTASSQAAVFEDCAPSGYDAGRQICFKAVTEKPFVVHLEPNERLGLSIPHEAWIEPDAYCIVDGAVIRDEFTKGTAFREGIFEIRSGFRFPVNVKITFWKLQITNELK